MYGMLKDALKQVKLLEQQCCILHLTSLTDWFYFEYCNEICTKQGQNIKNLSWAKCTK